MASETNAMISATEKIISPVVDSCMTRPFRIVRIARSWGSGISLIGTTSDTGRKVSSDLPRAHCPSEN